MTKTSDVDLQIVRNTYAKYLVGRAATEAFRLAKQVLSRICILRWDEFEIDEASSEVFRRGSGGRDQASSTSSNKIRRNGN